MTASAAVTRARRRRLAPHVPVRCGVVIGHSTFSATLVRIGMSGVRTTEVMAQDLEAPAGDAGWASLAAALMELAQRIGAGAGVRRATRAVPGRGSDGARRHRSMGPRKGIRRRGERGVDRSLTLAPRRCPAEFWHPSGTRVPAFDLSMPLIRDNCLV